MSMTRPFFSRATLMTIIFATVGAGCASQSVQDEMRSAVPSTSDLEMAVPGQSSDTSTAGAATSALIGQRAQLYQFTRDTSRAVNGSVGIAGHILHTIMTQPPSAVHGTYAVWGPWTETLSPVTYLLRVDRIAPNQHRYALSEKPRSTTDDHYVDVVTGQSQEDPSTGERSGTVLLDFDAAHAVDSGETPNVGRITVHYDLLDGRTIDVTFEHVADHEGLTPHDARYHFAQVADGSGQFAFNVQANLDPATSANENVVITSRWNSSGAGRGDALANGGDLGSSTLHMNECWDDTFGRTFYTDDFGLAPTEGDPAACVFADPLYASMSM